MPLPPEPLDSFLLNRRSKMSTGEDSSATVWAISYSDLLMVLMTFFIAYFSFPKERGTVINNMAESINLVRTGELSKVRKAQPPPGVPLNLEDVIESIQVGLLNGVAVDDPVKHEGAKISVDFPNNSYPPGQYQMTAAVTNQINDILKKVEPFQQHLRLTIIGHTDRTAAGPAASVIEANIALSTRRATEAAHVFLRAGWNPRDVVILGAAEDTQKTRTLSLILEDKIPSN